MSLAAYLVQCLCQPGQHKAIALPSVLFVRAVQALESVGQCVAQQFVTAAGLFSHTGVRGTALCERVGVRVSANTFPGPCPSLEPLVPRMDTTLGRCIPPPVVTVRRDDIDLAVMRSGGARHGAEHQHSGEDHSEVTDLRQTGHLVLMSTQEVVSKDVINASVPEFRSTVNRRPQTGNTVGRYSTDGGYQACQKMVVFLLQVPRART